MQCRSATRAFAGPYTQNVFLHSEVLWLSPRCSYAHRGFFLQPLKLLYMSLFVTIEELTAQRPQFSSTQTLAINSFIQHHFFNCSSHRGSSFIKLSFSKFLQQHLQELHTLAQAHQLDLHICVPAGSQLHTLVYLITV